MNQSHRAPGGFARSAVAVRRVLGLVSLITLATVLISCATAPVRDQPDDPVETAPVESGKPSDRTPAADADLPAESSSPAETATPAESGAKGDLGAAASIAPAQKGVPADAQTRDDAKGAVVANTPAETETVAAVRAEGGIRLLPEQGPGFWEKMMTPDVAWEYRAINGVSQCTRFVADMLDLYFGHDAYLQVFPAGVKGANETFFDWVENHDLVRLPPEQYSIQDIQELANQGHLILMAYYFPDVAGHVAFVGHKGLKLFTIPALGGLEGKDGVDLDGRWLPVMVQAGTYTGITSMVYATNGWLRNDNFGQGIVRYYFVRSGDEELPTGEELFINEELPANIPLE